MNISLQKFFMILLVTAGALLLTFGDNFVDRYLNKEQILYFSLVQKMLLVIFYAALGVVAKREMYSNLDPKERNQWRVKLYITSTLLIIRIFIVITAIDLITIIFRKILEQ